MKSRVFALLLTLCAATVVSAAPAVWPVENGHVTEFGGKHRGLDIAAAPGTEVRAMADGVVINRSVNKHCGAHVQVRHADGAISLYCNLADITVQIGDAVSSGARVGNVAAAPAGVRSHLHFELKIDEERVDPLTRLPRSPS